MVNAPLRSIAVIVCALAQSAWAQNIFPDPTFDRTGNSADGRGGGRCLSLTVTERTHWRAKEYRLDVEPFARYRATVYARRDGGKGGVYAAYGYEWNSFDWRFSTMVRVKPGNEWRQYTATFMSPTNTYRFHPLALLDAEAVTAWADDVVVEKIEEPEAVIAKVLAKKTLSDGDRETLARYHLQQGEAAKALALADGAPAYTRADIFCAVAKASEDLDERRECFGHMLANAGPAYANGLTRVAEILKGLPLDEQLAWVDAAKRGHASPNAVAACGLVELRLHLARLRESATCAAAMATLAEAAAALRQGQTAMGQKGCTPRFKRLFPKEAERLAKAQAEWDKRKAELGACTIKIAGEQVTPDRYAIVLPPEPKAHERYAAGELNVYIEKLTGSALEIVAGSRPADKNAIYVGRPPALRDRAVEVDFDGLGHEAFSIQTAARDLVIVGGRRGALYGVYTLLEDYLGCGWYMPGPLGEVAPRSGTFELKDIRSTQRPSFESRTMSSVGDAKWCARNKVDPTVTGSSRGIDKGDPPFFGSFGHNYHWLVNASKHFLTHPEYYSLVKGRRQWDRAQICTTNPEVVHLCARGIRETIERRPECQVFALCQNDHAGWCECPKCKKIDKKKGSVTDRLMLFCNAVSGLVRQRHPTKRIYTYAYQAGVDPPQHAMPAPELGVQLCHIRWPCCHVHPVATCGRNAEYNSWLTGWSKVCKQLYVYDYRVNYTNYLMPYPNCYAIARDVPYYRKTGVKALFYQGGGGAHNFGLCHWLIAKLMWNTEADFDALVKRFFAQYFGPAAKPMETYWRMLHDAAWRDPAPEDGKTLHMNLYATPPRQVFRGEFFAKADALLDEAERLAGEGIYRDRVQWDRITLYWVKLATLERKLTARQTGQTLTIAREGARDWRQDLARFVEIGKKFGIYRIREGGWRGDVDIRGFVEEVSGMTVHDRCDYRYLSGQQAHGGRRCVYVQSNTPGRHSGWRQRYPVILRGSTDYVASCWVKAEAGEGFQAEPLRVSRSVSTSLGFVSATTDWREVQTRFTTPSGPSAPVVLSAGIVRGQGKLWIDDVTIAPTASPGDNAVPNGDFERSRGTVPDYWLRPGSGRNFAWTEFPPMPEFLNNPAGLKIAADEPADHKVVSLDNGLVRVDIVPSLGGRIYRLVDRRSNVNHLYTPAALRSQGEWINYGGYEEYGSPAFAGPGWDTRFSCKVSSTEAGQQARLVADLGGMTLVRTVALPRGRAEVAVSSTLTNTSKRGLSTRLRVHPVFNVAGRRGEKELLTLTRDKKIVARRVGTKRADLWLRGRDLPVGAWGLRSPQDGSGVINVFIKRHVAVCYVCVQPHEGVNLELMSPAGPLKSGQSISIKHRYVLMPAGTSRAEFEGTLRR